MEVETLSDGIYITFDTLKSDDFYFQVSSLSLEKRAMPRLNLMLNLDTSIALRDKLSEVIKNQVSKLNDQMAAENPEQTAKEIADVIDWSFKEAK